MLQIVEIDPLGTPSKQISLATFPLRTSIHVAQLVNAICNQEQKLCENVTRSRVHVAGATTVMSIFMSHTKQSSVFLVL